MVVHLIEGLRWGLALKLRREEINTFTGSLYLVR